MILNSGGYELCHECGDVLTTGMVVDFFKKANRHVVGSPLCAAPLGGDKARLQLQHTIGFLTQDDDLKPKKTTILSTSYPGYRETSGISSNTPKIVAGDYKHKLGEEAILGILGK